MKCSLQFELLNTYYSKLACKMSYRPKITRHKIQKTMSVWSFVFAVVFAVAGFSVPPLGIIDGSVLYLCAQFLLLTASLLGVSAMTSRKG